MKSDDEMMTPDKESVIVKGESALNPRYLDDDVQVQLDCTTRKIS